jgi:hypothetical protein
MEEIPAASFDIDPCLPYLIHPPQTIELSLGTVGGRGGGGGT